MWSPSSLIFLALLGVWAAYFLQYWIRRRDHLATARSVEQFSEAMRVLERRDTTPRTDLSEPAPRSWNVHPARSASRPQVLVKRAVPHEVPSPVLTARLDQPRPAPARPAATEGPAAPRRRPTVPAATSGTARPAPARVRPGRRVRALLMLVALAELVGIASLVGLGHLAWWALAPAVVALVGSFAYVRAGVRAEQRMRAARRRPAPRAASAPTQSAAHGAARTEMAPAAMSTGGGDTAVDERADKAAEPAAVPDGGAQQPAAQQAAVEQPDVEPAVPAEQPEPVEQPALAAEAEEPVVEERIEYVHLVDEDDIPLTWEPVPVPRPTYTMKARAERPEVPPAAVTPDPAPVEVPADEGVPERRVAGA